MPPLHRLPTAFLGLLLGSLLPGCQEPSGHSGTNVLLVVIDTARADRFGCYGHPGGLTPHIDALAAEGQLFEQASAHAPWTLPSTASLLTSLHPPEHGAGGSLDLSGDGAPTVNFHGLPETAVTLAEAFRDSGWRTGAVVNVDFLDQQFGLTQGVEDLDARWYQSNREVRSATATTDLALEWIEEQGASPFFLVAHYFDAHAVYDPPQEFRKQHAAPVDQDDSNFVFGTRSHMLQLRAGQLELEPALIERASRLYEGELAYIDEQVGRLLSGLRAAGHGQNTLVVLTADHGEEFLDHGGFEHGHTLYEELLRVPLIVRLPGVIEGGRRTQTNVGLIDVAPTICELASVPTPTSFLGESLLGPVLEERPTLAHGNFWGQPLVSWRSGEWKLIVTPGANGSEVLELYNLMSDPREQRDRSATEPELLERLHKELKVALILQSSGFGGSEVQLDPETRRRLEALGYLGDGSGEDPPAERP